MHSRGVKKPTQPTPHKTIHLKRQRGEDTNLDSGIAIFDSGHHSQNPKTVRKSSQYFADFECSPI